MLEALELQNLEMLQRLCMAKMLCLQGVLADGRDSKRQLDRRVTEYDAARLKHLGHKANPRPSKWRKADDSEKIHHDMVHAQVGGYLQL